RTFIVGFLAAQPSARYSAQIVSCPTFACTTMVATRHTCPPPRALYVGTQHFTTLSNSCMRNSSQESSMTHTHPPSSPRLALRSVQKCSVQPRRFDCKPASVRRVLSDKASWCAFQPSAQNSCRLFLSLGVKGVISEFQLLWQLG
ncbi:unnamed protein product, partial [Ectocarpus sp. 12 AP-2014]